MPQLSPKVRQHLKPITNAATVKPLGQKSDISSPAVAKADKLAVSFRLLGLDVAPLRRGNASQCGWKATCFRERTFRVMWVDSC